MITAVAHRECQHVQGGGEARNLTGNVSIRTSEEGEGEGEGEASGADHLATALLLYALMPYSQLLLLAGMLGDRSFSQKEKKERAPRFL